MKTRIVVFLAGLLLSSQLAGSVAAEAANEGGHGGGAIVCGKADGTILSAELLDLWEKREAGDGSTISPNGASEAAQLEAALTKFASVAPEDVLKMREELAKLRTQAVADEQQLLPPPDTGLRRLLRLRRLRNCSLQGAAEFDDGAGVLTIDPEILGAMSPTDRAALKFHEALYKVWRGQSVRARNSLAIRRVTGAVFADQPLDFVPANAERSRARYECDAGGLFRFLVVARPDGRGERGGSPALEMHFTRYAGRPVIGKMVAAVELDWPLSEWARRNVMGSIPADEDSARSSVKNLRARLWDGFWHATVPAQRGQTNPSHYPPFAFHYDVALRATSEYEPSPAFVMWGGDFFTSDRHREISVNQSFSILSLTSGGANSRWQGVLQCRTPW